ncbi:MAG: hypothetical protein ACXQTS_04850 [Candidatus Methanospirareceae archaeon]
MDVGVVKGFKIAPIHSLPEDIQDLITFSGDCSILLTEDNICGVKRVIITKHHSIDSGKVVEIADKITEWYVDWHAYPFFDESFDVIVVGDVRGVNIIESLVERILNYRFGSIIFFLSQIIFFLAPPALIFYFSIYSRKRLFLWNIIAILALYSIEILLCYIVANLHSLTIPSITKYFGYSSIVLAPSAFLFMRYEESEEGQRRIRGYYERIKELIISLLR